MMTVVVAHIYLGPGVVRNTGNTITDLILTKTQLTRYYYNPHFISEETEAREGKSFDQSQVASSAGGGGIHTQVRIQIVCS